MLVEGIKCLLFLWLFLWMRSPGLQTCPQEPIKKPPTLFIQAGAEFASPERTPGPRQACFDSLSALDAMQTDDRKRSDKLSLCRCFLLFTAAPIDPNEKPTQDGNNAFPTLVCSRRGAETDSFRVCGDHFPKLFLLGLNS